MKTEERWLSVEEIAAHLGVSKETIYRWLDRGKVPAHRVGRLWKFKATEVDQWVVRGGATPEEVEELKQEKRKSGSQKI
ncbi:MAG: helix-turn-helix domain-containing protein [Oligoflexia bacterium]|nr:helix-turn-helix domain-containing protein [Oligoflexia bacterium]